MKTTIDRHRARLERARKRVEEMNSRIKDHLNACWPCASSPLGESCDGLRSLWLEAYEAIGRRKEAEAVLAEARRHG